MGAFIFFPDDKHSEQYQTDKLQSLYYILRYNGHFSTRILNKIIPGFASFVQD